MTARRGVVLILALAALIAFLAWLARATTTAEHPAPRDSAIARGDRGSSGVFTDSRSVQAPAPGAVTGGATTAQASTRPMARGSEAHRHLEAIDPCEAVIKPEIPFGFATREVQGVTVAWDPAVSLEAVALAYTTLGIVAEAAQLTGTSPRAELAVVVYASPADFRAKTTAPAWSDGIYDGAVRLPASPHEDFSVSVRSLRHEAMHAQLHTEIGCTPVWLDEGLAQYFSRTAPYDEWLTMLHAKHMIDLAAFAVPTVDDVRGDHEEVYAQSLAMLLYTFERGSDLKDLLQDARTGRPLELWSRRFPEATVHDLHTLLARRLFGIAPGAELDAIFDAAVCCYGHGLEISCHGAPASPGRRLWYDDKHEYCRSF